MHYEYPIQLEKSSALLVGKTNAQKSNKFGHMEQSRSLDDIAQRMRVLMRAHGIRSQTEFARQIEGNVTTVNNYFLAKSRPELSAAIAMVDRFRITLDWLYLGDWNGLPANVHDHLLDVSRSIKTEA